MTDTIKIIMRRGPGITLPGKPLTIEPPSWTDGLDEAEIGFTTSESRLFVGVDPEADVPQNSRLRYPYRNIEIIDANSRDGFAGMHGNRMLEGGESDYYSASLIPTNYGDIDGETPAAVVGTSLYNSVKILITASATYSDPPVVHTTPPDGIYWKVRYHVWRTGGGNTQDFAFFNTAPDTTPGMNPDNYTGGALGPDPDAGDVPPAGGEWIVNRALTDDVPRNVRFYTFMQYPLGTSDGATCHDPAPNNPGFCKATIETKYWTDSDWTIVATGHHESGPFGTDWYFSYGGDLPGGSPNDGFTP